MATLKANTHKARKSWRQETGAEITKYWLKYLTLLRYPLKMGNVSKWARFNNDLSHSKKRFLWRQFSRTAYCKISKLLLCFIVCFACFVLGFFVFSTKINNNYDSDGVFKNQQLYRKIKVNPSEIILNKNKVTCRAHVSRKITFYLVHRFLI